METMKATAMHRGLFWRPTAWLWRREMVRFLRQKQRVISALFTPLLFWVMLGFGFNATFTHPSPGPAGPGGGPVMAPAGISYMVYFFPGMLAFMLLSTAVYSTITIIEDRREGFLQGVLAAPVSRLSIVLGKVLGGATIATLQGMAILLLWPWVVGQGWEAAWFSMVCASGVLGLLAVAMTALGVCLAWPMDSTSGFHALMMILLMPMWFLSGAVFPITGAPGWLAVMMRLNPLTYGQAALTGVLTGHADRIGAPVSTAVALGITLLLTLGVLLLATALATRPRKDGLA